MKRNNVHSRQIPTDVLNQALDLLGQITTLAKPYLLALTPQQRMQILKMGDKTLAFVEKCHEYAGKNPQFWPSYLDKADFDIDFADTNELWKILNIATQFQQMLSDTAMVAGSETYEASLAFYNNVKAAAAQDIPGAKAIHEDLKKRYPRIQRRADTAEGALDGEAAAQ